MAQKKRQLATVHQAWFSVDWMKIPRTFLGGLWIDLKKSEKSVGRFQVTQGAVYFFPAGAKTKGKKLTFHALATLFKEHGQDYTIPTNE